MKENPLHLLMKPQSIATVGAGNNPLKMGTIQALSIRKDGYSGRFYPIHPTEETVLGCKAYASIADLPEAPDLAMFIVPTEQVIPLLEQFGKIGTRRAIIITAGFKETGRAGEEAEKRLLAVARRYGIRFLGPNCMGLINSAISLNVTVAPLTGPPGLLGLASQSGTYLTQTLPYLSKRGIRFSKAVSVGNEADIDLVDALEYLGQDEQTRAIALYIEGLRDGSRFLEAARKITPYKPVLAQYVGGSEGGARAGKSHTGSMAGPDYLYDGILKQAGVIRVHSVEELYAHGWVLAAQPPLRGKRVAVVTNSGGPGTAMAHTCSAGGLTVPPFSEKLQAAIRELIPPHAAAGNPVDLTFHLDTQVLSVTIPELIMRSGEVDAVVLHGAMGSGFMKAIFPHLRELTGGLSEEQFLEQFKKDLTPGVTLPFKHAVPLIISSFFDSDDDYTAAYREHNIPVFDAPEKAARGLLAMLHYYQTVRQRESYTAPLLPDRSAEAARIIGGAVESGLQNLDEYSSKQVLACYGIATSPERLARTEEEAAEEAALLGYPVAVKGCSPAIAHKTGRGLIYLDQRDESELRRAYRAVRKAAGDGSAVLVSKMVEGGREFVAGMSRRPGFGPCVMFGLGGIYTEILKDTAFRAAPVSRGEALEMLRDIRAAALLDACRGMPAVDLEALAEILQKVGFIPLLHPEVAEIDLNPILISGSCPVVVDALIVLK
ncbi:MAG: acetate--CoA ligase family protein [Bacillota bacterium]